MSVKRIEALCDAIGRLNQISVPESLAYQIRNPLLLKSYAKLGRHFTNTDGLRVFGSLLAGMKAGLFDLELKLKGLSRAGLKPTDQLKNLLGCYNIHEKQAVDSIIAFVRRALKDDTVSANTPLEFFLLDINDKGDK
jgi:hypothetical protein